MAYDVPDVVLGVRCMAADPPKSLSSCSLLSRRHRARKLSALLEDQEQSGECGQRKLKGRVAIAYLLPQGV